MTLPGSNTDTISKSDRSVSGVQPDNSTPTGGTPAGGGGGSVTSVAMTVPTTEFAVGGSPVTTAGTLALTKKTIGANLVAAGPASGAAATWAFRRLVNLDVLFLGLLELTTDQTVSTGAGGEAAVSWSSASQDTSGGSLWSSGAPTLITVPSGIAQMRLTVQARWAVNATGNRYVKIKDSSSNIWGAATSPGDATEPTYQNAMTPWIPVAALSITSFLVSVLQFSGGDLNLSGTGITAGGTCLGIEAMR